MKKKSAHRAPDPKPNPTDPAQAPGVEGEGSYTAARRYRQRTEDFVASDRVDQAARDAEPDDPAEAEALKEAENQGLARAKH